MLKTESRILNILLFIILSLLQLPQIIVGLVFLLIFRNKEKYTNPHNHVSVWNINSGRVFGTACFSTGPIIVTCEGIKEDILLHETGHSKQSIYFGPLFHIVISIPSICRFWYRRIFNKSMDWYHSGYPENWADKLGGVRTDIHTN